jgi:hypothetical protein
VAVNAVTATSSTDFVVVIPGAPTISSFSPTSGAGGVTVTVTGTNFDAAAGATTVKLNGVTGLSSVTDTSTLTFTVPGGAGSGKLSATTSAGTGTSAGDFIIPPPGMLASDIAASIRVSPGSGNGNIVIGTAGKSGVVLFDLQPNTFYSGQFAIVDISPTTASVAYKVVKPDNTVLTTGVLNGMSSGTPTIHLPMFSAGGTYSVVLSPGNATLNTNVRVEANPVLAIDGPGVASTLDYANQSSRFVINATAGQHLGLGLVGVAFTPALQATATVRPFDPTGVALPTATCTGFSSSTEGNCDAELVAATSGAYTIAVSSPSNAYANETLQVSSEAVGTLAADTAQAVSLTRVGQDARYTFVATAGDSDALDISGTAALLPHAQSLAVSVLKPDGTSLKVCPNVAPPSGLYCELGTVPTAGTYTVFVDPSFGAYGPLNLTLKQGVLLQTSDPPTSFSTAANSESARFRFTGTAAQNLSVAIAGLTYIGTGGAGSLTVFGPTGGQVGTAATCGPNFPGGDCRIVLTNLSQSGTYSVALQPPSGVKMSGNIDLSADITGTLTAGVGQAISATRSGQVARFAFAGTVGDSTSVKLYGLSTTPPNQPVLITVLKPDGTTLTSTSTSANAIVTLASLPSTGNYTVVMDPTNGEIWQATIKLDPGTAVSLDGPTVSPVNTTAGEPFRYTFAVTAGQRIDFGMSGLAYAAASSAATSILVYSPINGATSITGNASCGTSGTGSCDGPSVNAATTGTYSMTIVPPAASSITGGTFALSTPVAGSLVTGNPAQTVAISRSGQTARYTFSGTAAQLLRLNWTSTVVSGGTSVSVSVLKPDGNALVFGSFTNGASGGMDIPSLPTTGTYTVVFDPLSAATMSAAIALVTR